MSAITGQSDLSLGARVLWDVIRASKATRDRGRVVHRVGQHRLAARLGLSARQVRRLTGELVEGGWLVKIPHKRARQWGRWVSLSFQGYETRDPRVSAGHTDRTSMSGPPPFGGSEGPRRRAQAPRPAPRPDPEPPKPPDERCPCGSRYCTA